MHMELFTLLLGLAQLALLLYVTRVAYQTRQEIKRLTLYTKNLNAAQLRKIKIAKASGVSPQTHLTKRRHG